MQMKNMVKFSLVLVIGFQLMHLGRWIGFGSSDIITENSFLSLKTDISDSRSGVIYSPVPNCRERGRGASYIFGYFYKFDLKKITSF